MKYKNIQIATNMKAVDWLLVWDIILLKLGIGSINSIVNTDDYLLYNLMYLFDWINTDNIVLHTIISLSDGILYYFACNILLNERIKVNKI